jgi:hypothetical protein
VRQLLRRLGLAAFDAQDARGILASAVHLSLEASSAGQRRR